MLAQADRADGRHLLLADPDGAHRLWLTDSAPGRANAFLLPIDADFPLRVDAVLRFYRRLTGKPSGPLRQGQTPTAYQRSRLILQLRAFIGTQGGASLREVAAALIDPRARTIPAIEWKSADLRFRATRLVRRGIVLMTGGYLKLLRGAARRG